MNTALAVLDGLAPSGPPIGVTPVRPGEAARPFFASLPLSTLPPAGSAPRRRLQEGWLRLADVDASRVLDLHSPGPRLLVARHLDKGDIALLAEPGVALAGTTRPAPLAPPIPRLVLPRPQQPRPRRTGRC